MLHGRAPPIRLGSAALLGWMSPAIGVGWTTAACAASYGPSARSPRLRGCTCQLHKPDRRSSNALARSPHESDRRATDLARRPATRAHESLEGGRIQTPSRAATFSSRTETPAGSRERATDAVRRQTGVFGREKLLRQGDPDVDRYAFRRRHPHPRRPRTSSWSLLQHPSPRAEPPRELDSHGLCGSKRQWYPVVTKEFSPVRCSW
jgi:hypothetical protein